MYKFLKVLNSIAAYIFQVLRFYEPCQSSPSHMNVHLCMREQIARSNGGKFQLFSIPITKFHKYGF